MLGSLALGSSRVAGRLVGVVVVAAVWLLSAGGAWATTGHVFVGQFGGVGNGDGKFDEPLGNGPAGLAATASGEVVAVDEARVQRFSAAGVFASSFFLDPSFQGGVSSAAVDPSGAVYVATGFNGGVPSVVKYGAAGGVVYGLDASGSATSINAGAQVAVDPADGTVYVTATHDDGRQVIDRFDSTGAFLDFFDGSSGSPDGGLCAPTSLAVDGLHRVYVRQGVCLDTGVDKNRVDRYGVGGVFEATLNLPARGGFTESPSAVAADPVSDEVYVAHSDPVGLQITHFAAGGTEVVYTFDAPEVAGVRGMAVNGAGTVHTSDATTPFVERFTRFDGPAVVATGVTPSPGSRSAVLEGTIDPEGVASSYHFEYSTGLTFGSRTPEVDVDAGGGLVSVSAAVGGLRPNTTYNFRIVGSNALGSIAAVSATFSTAVAPATLDGTPPVVAPPFASAITPRGVRVHGVVNPNSNPFVIWAVEYGKTAAYGQTSTSGFVGGSGDDIPVVVALSGLEPGTIYHFRMVALFDGVGGSQQGMDQTFITAPAAGGGATDVTSRRARLTATINPLGVPTTYHFNYGPTASYGASTPEVDGGSADADLPVSQEISGLLPDTTYHVQVVATSADGVIRSGGDGLFRTAPAATAAVIGPTGVTTDAANLAGDVDTFGSTGSYHFDVWSLDSAYTTSTPQRPVAGNASVERVNAALTGLPAGETFVVQLTVTSNDSSSVSELLTFATAEVPKVFPPPPSGAGTSAYGCGSPQLDAYNKHPKPGETVTITGRDLGVGGGVTLDNRSLEPSDWWATGFKIVVPEDATGSLGLTVDCGRRSNTITVAVFNEPDNRFAIPSRSVTGSTATLNVRVPGPGKIESSGPGTRAVKVTTKKPGTVALKIRLTSAATEALARSASHARKVKVRVRYTPADGRPATKTVTITYNHKSGRR